MFVGYRFARILHIHADNTGNIKSEEDNVLGRCKQANGFCAHHSEIYFTRLVKWIACGASYRSLMSFVLLFHLHPFGAESRPGGVPYDTSYV